MTEEQAKTKVCCGPPIVAWLGAQVSGAKRIQPNVSVELCIGSDCMAWRTHTPQPETAQTEAEGADMPPEPPGGGWERLEYFVDGKHAYARWGRPVASTGWCGLAGKPE